MKNGNFFEKKKRGIETFEHVTKKYYQVYDEEINKMNSSNLVSKRDKFIKIWYKALLEFLLYDYNI